MRNLLLMLIICFFIFTCNEKQNTKNSNNNPGNTQGKTTSSIRLNSSAFKDGGSIPTKYCYKGVKGGKNISLPFSWKGIPEKTGSLAFLVVDKHPVANNWVHWMVINITPESNGLIEGASDKNMPSGSKELNNSWKKIGYGGPQPPKGSGVHDYHCILYALKVTSLPLNTSSTLSDFENAIKDKIISKKEIIGKYSQ